MKRDMKQTKPKRRLRLIAECVDEIGLQPAMIRRHCLREKIGKQVETPQGYHYLLSDADVKKIIRLKRVAR